MVDPWPTFLLSSLDKLHVVLLISDLGGVALNIHVVDVHILQVLVWVDPFQLERVSCLDVFFLRNESRAIKLLIDLIISLNFRKVGLRSFSYLIIYLKLMPIKPLSNLDIPLLVPLDNPHLPISPFNFSWTPAFISFYGSWCSLPSNGILSDHGNSQFWAVSSPSDNLWRPKDIIAYLSPPSWYPSGRWSFNL